MSPCWEIMSLGVHILPKKLLITQACWTKILRKPLLNRFMQKGPNVKQVAWKMNSFEIIPIYRYPGWQWGSLIPLMIPTKVLGVCGNHFSLLVSHPNICLNLGVQIRSLIDRFCEEHPGFRDKYLGSIGNAESSHFPGSEVIQLIRQQVGEIFKRNCPDKRLHDTDVNLSPNNTCIKANLVRLWLNAADHAEKIIGWLDNGAPCGLVIDPDLDGIFQRVEDNEEILPYENLSTDFETFRNYQGVEENSEADKAISEYIRKGFITPVDTLKECKEVLGNRGPVLSKLGCVVKTKVNELGQEITKTRIILDAKQSKVTRATRRLYKSELPRMADAVYDVLALMPAASPGETVSQLVADIVDAFWLIPVNKTEQKFFVARYREKYLIFNQTAQGSRGAPCLQQDACFRASCWEIIWVRRSGKMVDLKYTSMIPGDMF